MRHAFRVGQVEQQSPALDERGAVVEQQGRLRRQSRDEPVPHHPAERREVEHAVAWLHVAVQPVLLQVLQQRSAGAKHHALRHTGGARRVDDAEGMIELERLEMDFAGVERVEEVVERGSGRGRGAKVVDDDALLHRRQLLQDLCGLFLRIELLAAVEIAVGAEQHFRLDLAETVEHALHAEIGRTARPDRAEACGCQHRRGRFGQVRQVAGHAVSLLHAGVGKRLRQPGHQVVKVAMAQAALDPVLAPENDRVAMVARAQQVFGEVQPCVGKPQRARHAIAVDERARPLLPLDLAELPQQVPESAALRDRPGMQLVIASLAGEPHEARHVGLRGALWLRRPHGLHCSSPRISIGRRL